jgi:hypothetical protein
VFTDSPFILIQAEEQHRDHAVIEQRVGSNRHAIAESAAS